VRRTLTILVLAAAVAVLAAGCTTAPGDAAGGGGGDGGPAAPRPSEPTSSRGSASGAGADGVRIADFAFAPATVGAKAGQRVTWEHRDAGVTHTVAAVGGGFRSGDLEEGDTFSHRFPTAGTFAYRCTIHPDMGGTVTVSG
jgi:plastocyanin